MFLVRILLCPGYPSYCSTSRARFSANWRNGQKLNQECLNSSVRHPLHTQGKRRGLLKHPSFGSISRLLRIPPPPHPPLFFYNVTPSLVSCPLITHHLATRSAHCASLIFRGEAELYVLLITQNTIYSV